jgi:sugar lactone lactonase YvrE
MFRSRSRIALATALGAAIVLVAVPAAASPGSSASASTGRNVDVFPTEIALPDGFLPEGIAIGVLPFAFFGSRSDGDLYRVNLLTGHGTVFSQGPGTPSLGMKLDLLGRLFVAGGSGGDGRVVHALTGATLATYAFSTAPTFVNDVVLARDGAWFTDSSQAFLYRVPFRPFGRLPGQNEVVKLPLTGEWKQVAGINANGIARTPDGAALLVIQTATGLLFRVDPATGNATKVDLGGALLRNGDGLLLSGHTLFVVQNLLNQIAVVQLDDSATKGQITKTLTDPRFDVPTTVAAFGKRLYLPNARFTTPPTPSTTYNAVAIERPSG